MTERQKQIRMNIAAFILLFFVSLYRQISLKFLPDDPLRTYILYTCYIFLIAVWVTSIRVRVTQKGMRIFLMLEAAMMLFGLTIRFLQDTFWQEDVLLMRISGLYIAATVLPTLLFGLYATLGIGQADSYHVPKRWYGLLIPVTIMTFLIVSDESYHWMFYIVSGETQPNLIFHPYFGTFLMFGCGIVLMIVRVLLIYKRNRFVNQRKMLKWLISLAEPFLILVFTFSYFAISLQLIPVLEGKEVIELYARMYYIEVLTWEFYIYMGLVPVNTEYREIFECATIGMQIIGDDGSRISSKMAVDVSTEQIQSLKLKEYIVMEQGKELHAHRFSDGILLWNKDVSGLQSAIDDLNQSAETLAQEGALLDEEIKTKNQEASLLSKNQIYDELTKEVQGQLQLMKEITKKRSLEAQGDERLRALVLLGTYVKRRCNLRLIQKETGTIHGEDIRLSFEDMKSAMSLMGIHVEFDWNQACRFSSHFSIYLFDVLEYLLEYEHFDIKELKVAANQGKVQFTVIGGAGQLPAELKSVVDKKEYITTCENVPGGYRLVLSEGGE